MLGVEEQTFAAVAFMLAVTGCAATWKPLDLVALQRAKPKTMLLVHHDGDKFLGPNRSLLAGGLAGVVVMSVEGQRIRDEYNVRDPARDLGEEIAVAFANKNALLLETFTEGSRSTTTQQRNQVLAVQQPVRPTRDLYLDVRTSGWGVDAPLLGHATVYYTFSAKLLDGKTLQVLAEGDCGTSNLAAQRAAKRSYDDVLADNAAIVKGEIQRAADECREKLSAKLLFAPATTLPRAPATKAVPPPAIPAPARAQSSAPVPQQSDDE